MITIKSNLVNVDFIRQANMLLWMIRPDSEISRLGLTSRRNSVGQLVEIKKIWTFRFSKKAKNHGVLFILRSIS